jgi:hypothetical protein
MDISSKESLGAATVFRKIAIPPNRCPKEAGNLATCFAANNTHSKRSQHRVVKSLSAAPRVLGESFRKNIAIRGFLLSLEKITACASERLGKPVPQSWQCFDQ